MKTKLLNTALATQLVLCAAGPNAYAETIEERVENLETELLIAQEERNDAAETAANAMKVSGYADFEYSVFTDQPGKYNGFRLHHFSTFFTKQLAEDWRFFSEIEWEDGPKFEGPETAGVLKAAEGKIFVEAVNIDYLYNPKANVRVGRFFTPAGIWSIDHYPPFVPTQQRPEHIRKIFPQLIDGAMVYGTLPVGKAFINYDAYMGNGEGNTGHNDENGEKALGLKVSAILPALKYLEIGGTIYRDEQDTKNGDADKTAIGVHAKAKVGSWTAQFEMASAELKPVGGGIADEREGYYLQIMYDWKDWTFGGRYDTYNSDAGDSTTLTDDSTNTAFVNYHVTPNIVLKLEHNVKDDESNLQYDPATTTATIAIFLGD